MNLGSSTSLHGSETNENKGEQIEIGKVRDFGLRSHPMEDFGLKCVFQTMLDIATYFLAMTPLAQEKAPDYACLLALLQEGDLDLAHMRML